jgi:hypothetical protein
MDLSLPRVRTDFRRLDIPQPLRSGLALAGVGVLPLVAGVTGLVRPLSALVLAGIFVAAGTLRASLAYHELLGLRRLADSELRLGKEPYLHSALVSWRSAELTSTRHRTALARAAARTERDVSPATLPGASPLNRVAARPQIDLFRRLAERLSALDAPVTPHSVLLVEDLLTSSESPLYARERAGELRAGLLECLAALDGVPDALVAESSPASRHTSVPVDRKHERALAMMTSTPNTDSLRAAHSRLRRFAVVRRRSQR